MTDDEAFIRAIVAAPGDGATRLVYADWLDERGDPRGAYLRAELEWARLRSAAEALPLRTEGTRFDPGWVAQVCRPPLGVCCDRIKFTNPGPMLSAAEIHAFENRLGIQLPPDYRAFLMLYNGGSPDPAELLIGGSTDADYYHIERFEPLIPLVEPAPAEPPGYGLEWQSAFVHYLRTLDGRADRFVGTYLPVANTEYDLGYVFLKLDGAQVGAVFHFSDYCHQNDDPHRMVCVEQSFSAFLSRLTTYEVQ